MKGIIWRIIPILLVLLMFTHVIYYLSANTGEIITSAKIYNTRLKMSNVKKIIVKYSKEYNNPLEMRKKLTELLSSDKKNSVDDWGNGFIVRRLSVNRWLIISKGPDKKLGTSDDIKFIFNITKNDTIN